MLDTAVEFAFLSLCFERPELWIVDFQPVDPLASLLVEKLKSYVGQYNKYPNLETFLLFFKDFCESPQEFSLIKKRLTANELDKEFVQTKTLRYIEEQRINKAATEAISLVASGKIQEAQEKLLWGASVSYAPSFDYFKDNRPKEWTTGQHIPTGLKMDKPLNGGLKRHDFGVVLGPKSSGKSLLQINLGARAALMGEKVLHLSTEDRKSKVVDRYDRCFGNFKGKIKGSLIIQDFISGEASVADLGAYVYLHRPSLVLVDLLDEVKRNKYAEKSSGIGDIARGLKALAQRYNCALWAGKHTGKETKYSEDLVTSEKSFWSYEVIQVADVAVVLNQTKQEREEGEMRLLLDRNKDGPDNLLFDCMIDYGKMLILDADTRKRK